MGAALKLDEHQKTWAGKKEPRLNFRCQYELYDLARTTASEMGLTLSDLARYSMTEMLVAQGNSCRTLYDAAERALHLVKGTEPNLTDAQRIYACRQILQAALEILNGAKK